MTHDEVNALVLSVHGNDEASAQLYWGTPQADGRSLQQLWDAGEHEEVERIARSLAGE